MIEDRELETLLRGFDFLEDERYGIATGDLSGALPFFEPRKNRGQLCSMGELETESRVRPELVLPSYQSAVVLFKRYPVYERQALQEMGQIASLAVGEDYHRVHKRRLLALADHLKGHYADFEYTLCVDTGPLLDRQIAYQTGKVFYGKHQQVILPDWGAGFSIGYLLINQVAEPSSDRQVSQCGDCDRCIQACPTQALSEEGLDPHRCISYISQKKGELTDFEASSLDHYIYGCDICLLACPFTPIVYDVPERATVNVYDMSIKSNSEIKAAFRDSAILWKGASLLRRNATLVMQNKSRGTQFE